MARGDGSGACPQALSRPRAAREDTRRYIRPDATQPLPSARPGAAAGLIEDRVGALLATLL
ncbi:MAG: hypothetical protein GX595_07795 [Lentisphaerae bacterium]|nr:hypothetical protein [Lentisphaerota bacterium]